MSRIVEYIRSSRGNRKLLHEGFVYVLDRKKEEVSVNLQYQNLKEYKTKLLHYQSFCHQSRQYFYHRNFDFQKISLFSANCPFVKMSFWQKVRSSNCPFVKFCVRQNVLRHILSVRQTVLSFGMSFGKVSFGKMSGH